jgi:phosphomannomutase
MPSLPEQIQAAAKHLRTLVTRACSACPSLDPDADRLTEADYDAIALSLAKTMELCAETLADAGYETHEAAVLAESIKDELEMSLAAREVA